SAVRLAEVRVVPARASRHRVEPEDEAGRSPRRGAGAQHEAGTHQSEQISSTVLTASRRFVRRPRPRRRHEGPAPPPSSTEVLTGSDTATPPPNSSGCDAPPVSKGGDSPRPGPRRPPLRAAERRDLAWRVPQPPAPGSRPRVVNHVAVRPVHAAHLLEGRLVRDEAVRIVDWVAAPSPRARVPTRLEAPRQVRRGAPPGDVGAGGRERRNRGTRTAVLPPLPEDEHVQAPHGTPQHDQGDDHVRHGVLQRAAAPGLHFVARSAGGFDIVLMKLSLPADGSATDDYNMATLPLPMPGCGARASDYDRPADLAVYG
ncbi:hypothetical protein THAOC_37877, partial [Thalassiosira oceanica]